MLLVIKASTQKRLISTGAWALPAEGEGAGGTLVTQNLESAVNMRDFAGGGPFSFLKLYYLLEP